MMRTNPRPPRSGVCRGGVKAPLRALFPGAGAWAVRVLLEVLLDLMAAMVLVAVAVLVYNSHSMGQSSGSTPTPTPTLVLVLVLVSTWRCTGAGTDRSRSRSSRGVAPALVG